MDAKIEIPPINSSDPQQQKLLRNLLDRLKASDVGLAQALQNLEKIQTLSDNEEFFWLMVLENQVKIRYAISSSNNNLVNDHVRASMRKVLLHLVKFHSNYNIVPNYLSASQHTSNPGKVKTAAANNFSSAFMMPIANKIALILTKVFMSEYLSNAWANFFSELWSTGAIDMYLRVLEQIDNEVVDRTFESLKSQAEHQHTVALKDSMRERDIGQIVLNLQSVIQERNLIRSAAAGDAAAVQSLHKNPDLVIHALKILTKYISWIDIDLIINNSSIVQFLISSLDNNDVLFREPACQVFTAMFAKGMIPQIRLKFITTIFEQLQPRFQPWIARRDNLPEPDVDFVRTISECINQILESLCASFRDSKTSDPAVNRQITELLDNLIIQLAIELLHNDWNDVGEVITAGIREYLEIARKRKKLALTGQNTAVAPAVLKALLQATIRKMRHDDDHDFEELDEEEETDLALFFRDLRHMYEALGALDSQMVLGDLTDKVDKMPELEGNDLELVLRLIEGLADTIPSIIDVKNSGPHGTKFLIDIITKVVNMDLLKPNGHVGVHCTYYALLSRYERILFNSSKEVNRALLPKILTTLLNEKGIAHQSSPQARRFCCSACSRIIRAAFSMPSNVVHDILGEESCTQVLNSICGLILKEEFYDADDRLYLFETAGLVAVRATMEPSKWCGMLVTPCLESLSTKIQNARGRIHVESYVTAELEQANHYINCITRTSKAFTSKSSMADKNCEAVYLESLKIFLQILTLDEKLQSHLRPNIKQFIHRMVICLQTHIDTVIIPAIINTIAQTAAKPNPKLLIDLVPILSQIITKYTKETHIQTFCWPQLAEISYKSWQAGVGVNDEELESDARYIRRHYYALVAGGMANKGWLEELSGRKDLENFLQFLLDGLSLENFCDPQTIRSTISCLSTLANSWLKESADIANFLVVECCPRVMAFPVVRSGTNKGFTLSDPQLGLALRELGAFVKTLYKLIGDEFINFLPEHILRTHLSLEMPEIQSFCEALKSREGRPWVNFIRQFYGPKMLKYGVGVSN